MIDTVNKTLRRIPNAAVYISGVIYAVWLFYLGLTGGLGVEPINALERAYGEMALKLLVVGLAITPLRNHFGINAIKLRRALGVTAFGFVVVHLAVWLFLDLISFSAAWRDIVKRPYITIGMLAFVLMLPLAITSNNLSIRKLGPRWRKLHKVTYPIAVLASVHYIMVVKGWQAEPMVYLGVILMLLGLRSQMLRRRRLVGARS